MRSLKLILLFVLILPWCSGLDGTPDTKVNTTTLVPSATQRSDVTDNAYESSGDENTYDDEDYSDVNYMPDQENGVGKGVGGPEDENPDEWDGIDIFRCADGKYLGSDRVCDGFRDCYDCSDESNCTHGVPKFFYCYEDSNPPTPVAFSEKDPRCIPLRRFCDGMADCENGADEIQTGAGFKCAIKDRFRSCVLPGSLICDDIPHCEDESDLCDDDVGILDRSTMTPENVSSEATGRGQAAGRHFNLPNGFFRCLSKQNDTGTKYLISQNQVCDGIFDCADLSDECLCEIPKTSVVKQVCGGLCTRQIWPDQEINPNCDKCAVGEIYWGNATVGVQKSQNASKACLVATEILSLIHNTGTKNKTFHSSEEMPSAIVERGWNENEVFDCLDQSLSQIRARKCDGRPECLFGEDECGIDCKGGGEQDWVLGSGGMDYNQDDSLVCRLLEKDFGGYACSTGKGMQPNSLRNGELKMLSFYTPPILVCNGVVDCDDGSDEAYCATRLRCTDDNDTSSETYDYAQRCDGHAHCENGADERPEICSVLKRKVLPCDKSTDVSPQRYFSIEKLLDGKVDCPTGADECPPFLNVVPEIVQVYSDDDRRQNVPEETGISSHDRAIDNLGLQIFLVAASFVGLSALAASFVLVFYNLFVTWRRFTGCGIRSFDVWMRNSQACIREAVVNFNMTVAKAVVCGYFAYIKITRSEDANYSMLDLSWRSSRPCSIAGALCFIGTQVPLFTLAIFATGYVVARAFNRREPIADVTKSEMQFSNEKQRILNTGGRICARVLTVVVCVVLLIVTWVPVLLVAGFLTFPTLLHARTQTYAWLHSEGAPTLLRSNIKDQDDAARFASTLVTLSDREDLNSSSSDFSFPEFEQIVDSGAPFLKFRILGSFGYFAQSGACIPDFLVHANGGFAPYDMAVSNGWTHAISLAVIVVDLFLVLVTMAITARFGEAVVQLRCRVVEKNKTGARSGKKVPGILNSAFSSLVLVEGLTWLLITSLYFLKMAAPGGFSNYAYTVWCLAALGVNCGFLTPFLLLKRKFRIDRATPGVKSAENQQMLSAQDADRIIEINHGESDTEEAKPLTNGNQSPPQEDNLEAECESLVNPEDQAISPT